MELGVLTDLNSPPLLEEAEKIINSDEVYNLCE